MKLIWWWFLVSSVLIPGAFAAKCPLRIGFFGRYPETGYLQSFRHKTDGSYWTGVKLEWKHFANSRATLDRVLLVDKLGWRTRKLVLRPGSAADLEIDLDGKIYVSGIEVGEFSKREAHLSPGLTDAKRHPYFDIPGFVVDEPTGVFAIESDPRALVQKFTLDRLRKLFWYRNLSSDTATVNLGRSLVSTRLLWRKHDGTFCTSQVTFSGHRHALDPERNVNVVGVRNLRSAICLNLANGELVDDTGAVVGYWQTHPNQWHRKVLGVRGLEFIHPPELDSH